MSSMVSVSFRHRRFPVEMRISLVHTIADTRFIVLYTAGFGIVSDFIVICELILTVFVVLCSCYVWFVCFDTVFTGGITVLTS